MKKVLVLIGLMILLSGCAVNSKGIFFQPCVVVSKDWDGNTNVLSIGNPPFNTSIRVDAQTEVKVIRNDFK